MPPDEVSPRIGRRCHWTSLQDTETWSIKCLLSSGLCDGAELRPAQGCKQDSVLNWSKKKQVIDSNPHLVGTVGRQKEIRNLH